MLGRLLVANVHQVSISRLHWSAIATYSVENSCERSERHGLQRFKSYRQRLVAIWESAPVRWGRVGDATGQPSHLVTRCCTFHRKC